MPSGKQLDKIALTQPRYLQTLVENRRIYNLRNCELNIFESYEQAWRVPLTFHDMVITSMVQGKKVMHLFNDPAFDYLPGETVILPASETMVIDFPEASTATPTQCIALSVDKTYVNNTVNYLNEYYNSVRDEQQAWRLQFDQYHFANDYEISDLINKIIRVCSSPDRAKNIFADLNMKELLIRLIQCQHLRQVATETADDTNKTRLHYVLSYINEHISEKISVDVLCRKAYLSRNMFFRWFKEQCGVSPLEYINTERVKLAKQILADPRNNIKLASMLAGFSDVNYFVRVFRKIEGITPGAYQSCTTSPARII